MKVTKLLKTLVLALAAGSFTASAVAQWQWLDKDGRKVFSDRSPPGDIPEKSILKRPAGSAARAAPAVEAAATADAAAQGGGTTAALPKASAPKLPGRDTELEARKKKAEEEENNKKKAEEEKTNKARLENCARARTAMATLQSGVRVSALNANGEREVFDDTRRAAESKRIQDIIDSSCKGGL
ncbi:MAG: DUF4124 domain-containing protein [Pseudomonadota bacterium]